MHLAVDSDSNHRYRAERDRDRLASPDAARVQAAAPGAHVGSGRLPGRLPYAPLSSAHARGPRAARGSASPRRLRARVSRATRGSPEAAGAAWSR